MIGDFLIESRCRVGHTSSASFRNYARDHVEEVARTLADRCSFPIGEDEDCGSRVAHVVSVIGPPVLPPSSRHGAPPRTSTKPSMPAVVIVNDHDDNDHDIGSTEPPPSTEEPDRG